MIVTHTEGTDRTMVLYVLASFCRNCRTCQTYQLNRPSLSFQSVQTTQVDRDVYPSDVPFRDFEYQKKRESVKFMCEQI